jgi:hypothetical protein
MQPSGREVDCRTKGTAASSSPAVQAITCRGEPRVSIFAASIEASRSAVMFVSRRQGDARLRTGETRWHRVRSRRICILPGGGDPPPPSSSPTLHTGGSWRCSTIRRSPATYGKPRSLKHGDGTRRCWRLRPGRRRQADATLQTTVLAFARNSTATSTAPKQAQPTPRSACYHFRPNVTEHLTQTTGADQLVIVGKSSPSLIAELVDPRGAHFCGRRIAR